MKLTTRLFAATAAMLLSLGAFAQSFESDWEKAIQIKSEPKLFYNAAISPVWNGADSFVYTTNEPSGKAWYRIDINAGKPSKTAITEEEYNEASKSDRPRWEGDYPPFMRRGNEPQKSPDGKFEAFIKDNNVWVREAGASDDTQLSFDGTEDFPYERIMWSPDSKKIAASRSEVHKERQILLRESRPADKVQPNYRWLDYAKPGDVLPQTETALFNAEKRVRIAYSNDPYANQYSLHLGHWSPNSDYFTFEYNQRGHQVYQLVAVDANTGANRILADENTAKYDYKFIYYNMVYSHYFADGKRILWESERDGYNHFYMIDALSGSIKQLTKGEWNVRDVIEVNEEGDYILFTANGLHAKQEAGNVAAGTVSPAGKKGHGENEDPYNIHLCRLDLKSGKVSDLTPENANHTVSFSRADKSYFVDNYSRPDLPNTTLLRSSKDGSIVMEIHKQDITDLLKSGFTVPEVFVAKGRDGKTDIWGTIYRPNNYNPKKKYPVVEYIYAGPHDNHVVKTFINNNDRNRRLNELGFIVVCIDGMGTDNRSREFQDVCWQNLKDAGFPDRILWMQAAAQVYKSMDISNVGIYGYSAGGQNTMGALLFHPEFYKVGVALCGCHDNRMDKIWWNEQWMGYPIGPWYSESSNVDNAHLLQGKLFLINGEMDDNVDPASTLQVVSELVKAEKDFKQLYLPGHTHNLGSDYITKNIFKFLYENCK